MNEEQDWYEVWAESKEGDDTVGHEANMGGLKIRLYASDEVVVDGAPVTKLWMLWHSLCSGSKGFIIGVRDRMSLDQAKEYALMVVIHNLSASMNILAAVSIKRSGLRQLHEMGRAEVSSAIDRVRKSRL